jgi:hypothetical protein
LYVTTLLLYIFVEAGACIKDFSNENCATQLTLVVRFARKDKRALEAELSTYQSGLQDYERLVHATTVKLAAINEVLNTFCDALKNNVEVFSTTVEWCVSAFTPP